MSFSKIAVLDQTFIEFDQLPGMVKSVISRVCEGCTGFRPAGAHPARRVGLAGIGVRGDGFSHGLVFSEGESVNYFIKLITEQKVNWEH
jgi:hypothetical protein